MKSVILFITNYKPKDDPEDQLRQDTELLITKKAGAELLDEILNKYYEIGHKYVERHAYETIIHMIDIENERHSLFNDSDLLKMIQENDCYFCKQTFYNYLLTDSYVNNQRHLLCEKCVNKVQCIECKEPKDKIDVYVGEEYCLCFDCLYEILS